MFEEIPSIIASSNPIVLLKGLLDKERGIYAYRMEIFIGPTTERPENKFSIASPVIVLDCGETVRRMFPNEARLRNLTYAAQVNADIFVRFTMTEFTGTPPVMTLNDMGEPVTRVEELAARVTAAEQRLAVDQRPGLVGLDDRRAGRGHNHLVTRSVMPL